MPKTLYALGRRGIYKVDVFLNQLDKFKMSVVRVDDGFNKDMTLHQSMP